MTIKFNNRAEVEVFKSTRLRAYELATVIESLLEDNYYTSEPEILLDGDKRYRVTVSVEEDRF